MVCQCWASYSINVAQAAALYRIVSSVVREANLYLSALSVCVILHSCDVQDYHTSRCCDSVRKCPTLKIAKQTNEPHVTFKVSITFLPVWIVCSCLRPSRKIRAVRWTINDVLRLTWIIDWSIKASRPIYMVVVVCLDVQTSNSYFVPTSFASRLLICCYLLADAL